MSGRTWLVFTLILASWAFAAGQQSNELPSGEGRVILETACAACHDWKDVTKFRGYKPDEWADLVNTMVQYGAKLDEAQSKTLIEYLVKNLGPDSRNTPAPTP
jgi:mono/diheme cytochrome c family protein